MKMTGNTILITGGGSGIGRGLAEAFHALGNQVVIAGRGEKRLDETTAANPGMKSLTVDMADAGSIRALAAKVVQDHPELNVLINMAGVMKNEKLLDQEKPLDAMEATVATNLLGPIRLTAALLPTLLKQPRATVMNVSSGLAFVPLAMTPTYCATKAAIHSYTQSLRYQLKDTAVEVLELIPPYVQTGLMGERQAKDPMAMPLADYIAETMSILTTSPEATEICVERVKSRRFAEANGGYDAFFKTMNDAMSAARLGE
jgi:uncharacterized oxidoreductase